MELRLTSKKHETSDIWSFDFAPENNISWQAGQSIRLEIPKHTWGYNERRFTISSLPKDHTLRIITRISDSEFKHDLNKLKIGDYIKGYNIEGKLDWGNLSNTKIFIAGGTGITLFHMAIRQALSDGLPIKIMLLYSSRDKPMLFEDYFDQISKKYTDIKIIKSNQRFDASFVMDKIKSVEHYDLHVAGPNDMVFGLKNNLEQLGVDQQKLHSKFLQ